MSKVTAELFVKEVIEELKKGTLKLPTLPDVAMKVRQAIDDENSNSNDIANVISSDPALSARLILMANSAMMRGQNDIEDLKQVVNRLGLKMIRDLVTSIVVKQMFVSNSPITEKRLRDSWEHSTSVAAICHVLATQYTKLQPEQAMLAGLVHDIGALPIITKAEKYPELLQDAALLDKIIFKLHTSLGRIILTAWGFPAELIQVASEHENLERDSATVDLVDIVTVANLQSYVGSDHPLTQKDWSNIPAFSKLGLNPEVNIVDVEETAEDIENARRILVD
ncbi:MAG: HDOD domain-containing protein [Gammaproteobacteria bacterium]|nr:HDOD domain-containing protein [Gammaproteobacteria bacterium]